MLDNLGESLIFGFFRFLCRLVFDFFAFYPGEIVLFVLSGGKKKPRWDFYALDRPTTFIVFTQLSVWVGIIFWGVVFVGLGIIAFP